MQVYICSAMNTEFLHLLETMNVEQHEIIKKQCHNFLISVNDYLDFLQNELAIQAPYINLLEYEYHIAFLKYRRIYLELILNRIDMICCRRELERLSPCNG